MGYMPDDQSDGTGPVLSGLAVSLALGLVWELLLIQDEWRLGFRPPVWEVLIGWLGMSAFVGFALVAVALGAGALKATSSAARNPESWEARQAVARMKRRTAAFIVGAGGAAAFGGIAMWFAGRTGPEFEGYAGFARLTAFAGIAAVIAAIIYLRRGVDISP